MKVLSVLLFALNVQQLVAFSFQQLSIPFASKNGVSDETRNERVQALLQEAQKVGQVGSLKGEEEQARMEELASALNGMGESKPARVPLSGEHQLVYSAAPGASSGRVFGNVVGKVSQYFPDDEFFYNRVRLGPLEISLKAKREIKNDSIIKVSFLQMAISLFGKTVKESDMGGGGVWKVKFAGKVQDANGKEKFVRVMETPSLFVLEQPL